MKFPPWHQRPDEFDPETHREGILDSQSFLRVADQFISLANQRNKKIESTELQMVMLYAAARYAAHVGKNVLEIEHLSDPPIILDTAKLPRLPLDLTTRLH